MNRIGLPWIDVGDVIVTDKSMALVLTAEDGLIKTWVWLERNQVVDMPWMEDDLHEAMIAGRVIMKRDGTAIVGPEDTFWTKTQGPASFAWIKEQGWVK